MAYLNKSHKCNCNGCGVTIDLAKVCAFCDDCCKGANRQSYRESKQSYNNGYDEGAYKMRMLMERKQRKSNVLMFATGAVLGLTIGVLL